jgi:hypothetical protein
MIKVHDGTKQSAIHLCDKCVHARSRTHDNGHVERQCNVGDERSRWSLVQGSRVVECSVYFNGGEIGLNAMRSIAWSYLKSEDGIITFVDNNAMNNPQVYSKHPTLWQRFKRYFR